MTHDDDDEVSWSKSSQCELDLIASLIPGRAIELVLTWMGARLRVGKPSRYVTTQLGQFSLASQRGN